MACITASGFQSECAIALFFGCSVYDLNKKKKNTNKAKKENKEEKC